MKVKRALISVSDKTGLEFFARELDGMGVEIISTGGTARLLGSLGIKVREVSSFTGFPEMLDGRVKTLHPRVHAAILALRDNAGHMSKIKEEGIPLIDMVVVNLYPFQQTIAREGVELEEAIENIDIGGPAMLRSAAKNFASVAVLSSPEQYAEVIAEMKASGGSVSARKLQELAAAVFEKTSGYDGAIAEYLLSGAKGEGQEAKDEKLPEKIDIKLEKVFDLRYGENPHQRGAFYRRMGDPGAWLTKSRQLQGKELSFNNILDLSSALDIALDFDLPAVSIVKHNNPCGAATADTPETAFLNALDCDRMSAFGGIIGFNRPIDGPLAARIIEEVDFFECVIAPDYDREALSSFSKKKNLRVIKFPASCFERGKDIDIKKIPGGVLVQDADSSSITSDGLKAATEIKPSKDLIDSLLFAWKIVRFVKSNAIVLCRGTSTVGIGAGQMSRVDSVMTAARKAGDRAKGSVMASDAFFPKADSIEQARASGIKAIIQPGGSIRDQEVIDACNRAGIPMLFTGKRHFRH
jgi:phosphoribosylaminoimidazolecarboxamide formyltransferase / IMP cyclohydrolase